MTEHLSTVCLIIVLAPLVGSIIAGFFRNQIGRAGAHCVTILGVAISFCLSVFVAKHILYDGAPALSQNLYAWLDGGDLFHYKFTVGFLIDELTSVMLLVVTFVSLLVHIYSIGYMADDDGYQRFFSYISLFTFMMLMLVTAKNLFQLFFGWEGVGLASYLLIGFWYKKETAIQGSLKAFLVNRVGDFGFLLGMAVLYSYAGSIEYQTIFNQAASLSTQSVVLFGTPVSVVTLASMLLFVGAMGKSAQVPLHVWLPESMEGPTPISALIHAATMVTAGIFMVSRMSPLFEYSETTLSFIMIIGATGALFTGLIAIVMHDIKRVVAYSTLSQLGYMMASLGASAYAAGVFHLATHACFKALLFLGAGSVIIACHHEQDMRKMGGLWKYMPITYVTFLIGTLALVAIPPFSGFYSKDLIIEAVAESHLFGSTYAAICVQLGAFVTAVYSFRALFLTFHGDYRYSHGEVSETPMVVWLPLVVLAIPSIILGALAIQPMLFAKPGLLDKSIFVLAQHDVLATLAEHYHGALGMVIDSVFSSTFWLTISGTFVAWVCYILKPAIPSMLAKRFSFVHKVLLNKYGLDAFNDFVFIRGARSLGSILFKIGDVRLIDGLAVNGSAAVVNFLAARGRLIQTGYLFHYVTVMVLGLLLLLSWLMLAKP